MVKTKSQKVLGLTPTFVEVTGEKLVGGWEGLFRVCYSRMNMEIVIHYPVIQIAKIQQLK